jgi:hypothetical protein
MGAVGQTREAIAKAIRHRWKGMVGSGARMAWARSSTLSMKGLDDHEILGFSQRGGVNGGAEVWLPWKVARVRACE